MGFWDWATTGREAVQNFVTKPKDPGTFEKYAISPLASLASDRLGGGSSSSDAVPGAASLGPAALQWLSTTPEGQQYLAQNQATVNNAGQVSGTGAIAGQFMPVASMHDPASQQGAQAWNPLAVNMFYSTAIAPIVQALASQFQGMDQDLYKQAQNAPGQQYLTPSQQGMSQLMLPHMAMENNNISQAMLGASLTAPVIDSIQNQMSTLSQRALQAYTEALRANQSTDLTSLLGGTGTTSANPTDNSTIQAAIKSATGK